MWTILILFIIALCLILFHVAVGIFVLNISTNQEDLKKWGWVFVGTDLLSLVLLCTIVIMMIYGKKQNSTAASITIPIKTLLPLTKQMRLHVFGK
jgi:hypothetical protein